MTKKLIMVGRRNCITDFGGSEMPWKRYQIREVEKDISEEYFEHFKGHCDFAVLDEKKDNKL